MTEAEFTLLIDRLLDARWDMTASQDQMKDARTELAAEEFRDDLRRVTNEFWGLRSAIIAEFKRLKAIEEEPPVTRQIRTDRG